MEKQETRQQLYPGPEGKIGILEALSKVSQKIGAIGKDKKNTQQNFMYRSIDAIMSGIHDALAEQNIVVTNYHERIMDQERTTNKGGTIYYKEKDHTFVFRHKDGSRLETTLTGAAMDTGDKADNKCLSIALKYALTTLFIIPLQTDDPDAVSHPPTAGNKKREVGPPASEGQIKKIYATRHEQYDLMSKMDPEAYPASDKKEQLKSSIQKAYKTDDLKNLSVNQASDLITRMTEAIEKIKAKEDSSAPEQSTQEASENGIPKEKSDKPNQKPQDKEETIPARKEQDEQEKDEKLQENIQKMKSMGKKTDDKPEQEEEEKQTTLAKQVADEIKEEGKK